MTMPLLSLRTFRSKFFAALRNEDGLAAIELILVLPVGLVIIFGAFAAAQAYEATTKAEYAAAEVTDIVSQQGSMTSSQLSDILAISAAVLTPFDPKQYKITVSQVAVDANGVAKVSWSDTYNGVKLTPGDTISLPSGVGTKSSYVIYATASYAWTPPVGGSTFKAMTLEKTIYRRVRSGTEIKVTAG